MERRERHQQGSVVEVGGAFYVRYWCDGVKKDGTPGRVQRSQRLCEKDAKHYSRDCKPVRLLRDGFMATINAGQVASHDMPIADFWNSVYLPWAQTVNPKVGEPNLRPSSLEGYQQIWEQHLKAHFDGQTLRQYRTAMATEFLTGLSSKVGRSTLAHVRSLMSGIFSLAMAKGLVDENDNPIKGAFSLYKTAPPKRTRHYTLNEVLEILRALADRPECQLVMA